MPGCTYSHFSLHQRYRSPDDTAFDARHADGVVSDNICERGSSNMFSPAPTPLHAYGIYRYYILVLNYECPIPRLGMDESKVKRQASGALITKSCRVLLE